MRSAQVPLDRVGRCGQAGGVRSSSAPDPADPVVVMLDGLAGDVHLDELHDRVGELFRHGSTMSARGLLDLAAVAFLACGASSAAPLAFDELERR